MSLNVSWITENELERYSIKENLNIFENLSFHLHYSLTILLTLTAKSQVTSQAEKKWGLIYLHQDIVILLYCCFKRKTEKKKNMIVL